MPYIDRDMAIKALIDEGRNVDSRYLESERIIHESDAVEAISMLPTADVVSKEQYNMMLEHANILAEEMRKYQNTDTADVVEREDIEAWLDLAYKHGWSDCFAEHRWIPVTERLPEESINSNTSDFEKVLCST